MATPTTRLNEERRKERIALTLKDMATRDAWIAKELKVSEGCKTSLKALYNSYRHYVKTNYPQFAPMGRNVFSRGLVNTYKNNEAVHKYHARQGVYFLGLVLQSEIIALAEIAAKVKVKRRGCA